MGWFGMWGALMRYLTWGKDWKRRPAGPPGGSYQNPGGFWSLRLSTAFKLSPLAQRSSSSFSFSDGPRGPFYSDLFLSTCQRPK